MKKELLGTQFIDLLYKLTGFVATSIWFGWYSLLIFIIATMIAIIINRIIKN